MQNNYKEQKLYYYAVLSENLLFESTLKLLLLVKRRRKYGNLWNLGALIVGDVPAERQEEFREYMVEIDKDMSPAEIRAILEKWIADDEGRIARYDFVFSILLKYSL